MPEQPRPSRYQPYAELGDPNAIRLGDLIVHRKALVLFCSKCCHSTQKDPATLARRVGYDATVVDVIGKARCSQCGSRKVEGSVKEPRRRG
jgi:hypothetical protein